MKSENVIYSIFGLEEKKLSLVRQGRRQGIYIKIIKIIRF